MIFDFFKYKGETTLQALQRCRIEKRIPNNEKVTFVGRLDPMAKGKILILTGADVHRKDLLNKSSKKYKLKVLFGATTDTGDILGLHLGKIINCDINIKRLRMIIRAFAGTIKWQYPCFSSKTYKGKQLLWYALEGRCPERRPEYEGEIFDITIFDLKTTPANKIYSLIKSDLAKLKKSSVKNIFSDFRKEEILERWSEVFSKYGNKNKMQVLDLELVVSHSVYMRTFVKRLGEKLNCKALALEIERKDFLEVESVIKSRKNIK